MRTTVEKLAEDKLRYCDVLEVLRRNTGEVLYDKNDSFLVYDRISGTNYILIAADNPESVLDYVKDDKLFCAHVEYTWRLISRAFQRALDFECYQALYNKKILLDIKEFPAHIRQLDETHINIVETHYQSISTAHYIEGRIKEGMFGVFEGSSLAAFIGKHEEGSIGMLFVLPEYRHKGYGENLTAFMVNRCLNRGEIPYGQVTVNNEASYRLHQKLGFDISRSRVYWLY